MGLPFAGCRSRSRVSLWCVCVWNYPITIDWRSQCCPLEFLQFLHHCSVASPATSYLALCCPVVLWVLLTNARLPCLLWHQSELHGSREFGVSIVLKLNEEPFKCMKSSSKKFSLERFCRQSLHFYSWENLKYMFSPKLVFICRPPTYTSMWKC